MKIHNYYAVLCSCLAMLSVTTTVSGEARSVYMSEYCGTAEYNLLDDAIFVVYEAGGDYLSCTVPFHTSYSDEMLLAKALDVNFDVFDCNSDYVTIQDGDQSGDILVELCDNYAPSASYASTGTWLTLDYEASNYESSFKVLITRFTNNGCYGKFQCDNGRCIGESLICDGWNNCGDDSDETRGCTTTSTTTTTTTSSPLPDIYMNEHCGETEHPVNHPAVLLIYTADQDRQYCNFALDTGYIDDERFMVKAIRVDFSVSDCETDYVTISNPSSSQSYIKKFCESYVPNRAYTTTDTALALSYETSNEYADNTFKLLITKFTEAPCNTGSQFRCDNDRCIDSTLMCDTWNNCGDNSDEIRGCNGDNKPYLTTMIAGISLGSIGVVALFVVLVVLIARRRRRSVLPVSQPPTYGSITPVVQPYIPVMLPPAYTEKINTMNDVTGYTDNHATQSNTSVNA